VLKDQNIFS